MPLWAGRPLLTVLGPELVESGDSAQGGKASQTTAANAIFDFHDSDLLSQWKIIIKIYLLEHLTLSRGLLLCSLPTQASKKSFNTLEGFLFPVLQRRPLRLREGK